MNSTSLRKYLLRKCGLLKGLLPVLLAIGALTPAAADTAKLGTVDRMPAAVSFKPPSLAPAVITLATRSLRLRSPAIQDQDTATFDAWSLLTSQMDFALDTQEPDPDVSLQRYFISPRDLLDAMPQATLYLPYVTERLVENDLPPELALLPFLESAYNPMARSPRGAAGLWQITGATADGLGLKRDQWWDGRNDVIRSTDAAIDYLSYLNRRFDGDWLLALAAYNSGEGTVSRAMARNQRQGADTDFWNLRLPAETRIFVPKFLALARLVNESDLHAEWNPSPEAAISTGPIAAVALPEQISLQQAARLADMDYQLLRLLNTGLKQDVTPPDGPHRLVLPQSAAERLLVELAPAY